MSAYCIPFQSERQLEDYVCSCLAKTMQCPVSGHPCHAYFRQQRIGDYGISDIIKVEIDIDVINVTVLELKNETLRELHISQLCRYMRGIERIVSRYKKKNKNLEVCVYGELAGPLSPDSNDLVFMLDFVDRVQVYDVALSMEHGFISSPVSRGWFKRGERFSDCVSAIREVSEIQSHMASEVKKVLDPIEEF